MRVHDLRRTAIAWMREAGVEIDVVQKIVGHRRIAATIDAYGMVNRRRPENVREKLSPHVIEGGR